jgi:hypothetical protein
MVCVRIRVKSGRYFFSLLPFGVSILLALCILLSFDGLSQERCGMVAYEQMIHGNRGSTDREARFEQWVRTKIIANGNRTLQTNRIASVTYTIPVVVHIIHNGEAVGSGTNISDAQIQSQIQVLNDDYKRLNADASNTPVEFAGLAGSIDMQFVLAQQDPEGLPTNGITRTQGTKTSWTLSDNSQFKGLSYWPAENYLNIWVINFAASTGLLGYAQLPTISDPNLAGGLEDSSSDRLTDGVAIHYKDFGSGSSFNLDAAYNKGRTATHEVGHFFGLRHIWGDGNCATDYVADTPTQPNSTSGCPSNPANVTCSDGTHHKMFQNYMDYTNDACMNLFTKNQVDRMVVILQNSPRRTSLLTSPGASPPVAVANDVGIRQIVAPQSSVCSGSITPQIEIKNYGNNNVISVQVQVTVNSVVTETKTFAMNLTPLQSAIVSFNNPISFTTGATPTVSFAILATNGTTDGNAANNTLTQSVTVPSSTSLPVLESFNAVPAGWQILNPDGLTTWANVPAPDAVASNRAMYMDFHDYDNQGTTDWLVTPSFTLSNALTSQMKFNRAYAQYPGETGDELMVYALPSCSHDLSQGILLFDASGTTLATASSTSSDFTPSSATQWKTEVKSLSTLSSSISYQLAFVGKNGWGNNLYIDTVVISDQEVNDVGITAIVSPGLVHCLASPSVKFKVRNYSTSVITTFDVVRVVNGGAPVTQTFNVPLDLDEEKVFTLNPMTLKSGENQITVTINNPNGLPDSQPANNTITFRSYLDQSTDSSPLRMTFDNPLEIPWIMTTPTSNAKDWETITTTKKTSATYKAFSNTTLGEESWLASPVLDLTRYSEQNLFFDLSYAQRIPKEDRLRILASTDCGGTYDIILYDEAGNVFQDSLLFSEWLPPNSKYWSRQRVSLDTVSGKNNVRLAFVAVNANGNNIYLDNIEIFAGDDVNPPVSSLPYQFYYPPDKPQYNVALTFTLEEKKDVRLQIFSLMGQVVSDTSLPDTLNQTYYFDMSTQTAGIYLFRLQIDDQFSTTKVFVGH